MRLVDREHEREREMRREVEEYFTSGQAEAPDPGPVREPYRQWSAPEGRYAEHNSQRAEAGGEVRYGGSQPVTLQPQSSRPKLRLAQGYR